MGRGVRQGCIMSPWLLNVYIDDEGGEDGDGKEGSEFPWRVGESGDCLASCIRMT